MKNIEYIPYDKIAVTFIGQAGFIFTRRDGFLVGIDLYLSDCCYRFFGFKRLMPYIVQPSELDLDVLISTHAHYDHFDPDSVPIIMSNKKTKLVCAYDVRDVVSFICHSESANAIFSKKKYIDDSALYIKYRIQNPNTYALPYIWAGHMMFAGRQGAYVFTNYPDTAEKRIMFGNPPGIDNLHVLREFSLSGENISAGEISLRGGSCKYYYTEQKAPVLCGIRYGNSDETVTVSFTGDTVRYLGIWINNGGFKGMYNIALESCTAPYDSPVNAIASGNASFIPPESSVEFIMKIHYELEIIC